MQPQPPLAMDVQGLDALRLAARGKPQQGLKQASQQFEALFLQMMLKSMREATPGEHVLGGSAEKFYTGMLDQQLGQSLSGRGLGLAEAMQRQLMRFAGEGGESAGAASARALTPALSQGERGQGVERGGESAGMASARALTPALSQRERESGQGAGSSEVNGLNTYERATAAATWSRSALAPAHVERFMAQHLGAAQRAGEASGVPAQLILAQAALESGWGRREPRGQGGEPSFNLFGIKADKSWKGPSVEALTTEVVDGQPRQVRARFRAYGSYEQAFGDHAQFLTRQPRYAPVLAAPDAHSAAQGLQRAGYASDPNYAAKLQQLLRQMS